MIGHLVGTLVEKSPPALVVDVQGVGYELDASMSTHYVLPAVGEAVRLYTHLLVREDAQLLYGFATRVERGVFRALLKVNGVGAKVALTILSGMSVDDLVACVERKDVDALVRIPGIGKKTAERLLVEMQDKVVAGTTSATMSPGGVLPHEPQQQAEEALLALGYRASEARRLIERSDSAADGAPRSVEEIIRAALQSVRSSR